MAQCSAIKCDRLIAFHLSQTFAHTLVKVFANTLNLNIFPDVSLSAVRRDALCCLRSLVFGRAPVALSRGVLALCCRTAVPDHELRSMVGASQHTRTTAGAHATAHRYRGACRLRLVFGVCEIGFYHVVVASSRCSAG